MSATIFGIRSVRFGMIFTLGLLGMMVTGCVFANRWETSSVSQSSDQKVVEHPSEVESYIRAKPKRGKKDKKADKNAGMVVKRNKEPSDFGGVTTTSSVLQISGTQISGEITVVESPEGVREVELSVLTDEPPQLTVDEMVAGEKRIWLRAVDATLRSPEIISKKSTDVVEIQLSGKAKAYVQLELDRIRTVVDLLVTLKKPADDQWSAEFEVTRGERSVHQAPFVESFGDDFSIYIAGTATSQVSDDREEVADLEAEPADEE